MKIFVNYILPFSFSKLMRTTSKTWEHFYTYSEEEESNSEIMSNKICISKYYYQDDCFLGDGFGHHLLVPALCLEI